MGKAEWDTGVLLRSIAAQFREGLSDLHMAEGKRSPSKKRRSAPLKDKRSPYADRGRLRMARLARNIETCAALIGGEPLKRENSDIVRLISTICEESADLAEYLGLDLTFLCAEESHFCAIHAEYVRQLAYHLLSNAMKHTPSGGRVRVSLRFQRPARRVLLSVEDNGSGIAADRLPALFDSFQRNPGNPDAPRGIGLGLPICKLVAEAHGGFMAVESELGKGSKFTLNIPDEASKTVQFRQRGFFVSDGGTHPGLLELSDALPAEAFRIGTQS